MRLMQHEEWRNYLIKNIKSRQIMKNALNIQSMQWTTKIVLHHNLIERRVIHWPKKRKENIIYTYIYIYNKIKQISLISTSASFPHQRGVWIHFHYKLEQSLRFDVVKTPRKAHTKKFKIHFNWNVQPRLGLCYLSQKDRGHLRAGPLDRPWPCWGWGTHPCPHSTSAALPGQG